jgi:hypothetical protein
MIAPNFVSKELMMATENPRREERRHSTTRTWTGPERRSRFAAGAGGQLLERGEGVADPVGSLGDDRDLFSSEGEPGSNVGGPFGGPVHPNDGLGAVGTDDRGRMSGDDPDGDGDDPDRIDGGTGGEGGFSSLAGGRFPAEGSSDDAPNYGDWLRHSTGGTSGAVGHEGFDFDGENTWGEEQRDAERKEETGG